jgi:hypothetical protein
MRVDVTLDNSGSHPNFLVKCYGKEGQVWETKRRFAPFRDFHEKVKDVDSNIITAEFPPTIASSAYGIKLTEKQLSERRKLLNNVIVIYELTDVPTNNPSVVAECRRCLSSAE